MNQNQKSTGGKAPRKWLATKASRDGKREPSSESLPNEDEAQKARKMAEEYMANLQSEIPQEIKDAISGSNDSKLLYLFIMQMKILHHA